MTLYTISNLAANDAAPLDSWGDVPDRPAFKTKADYQKWCRRGDTSHSFVSGYEGTAPTLRVHTANNPPVKLHGIVVDYDAQAPEAWEETVYANAGAYVPNWASTTQSGGMRLYFEFEEPVLVPPSRILDKFLTRLQTELGLPRLLPGYDRDTFRRVQTYYEAGAGFTPMNEDPVPVAALMGWIQAASVNHDWTREGVSIPLEVLRERGRERFPDAIDWDAFETGLRCHRFWEPGADADSVIVRETGFQAFTGDQPFLSWADVFGAEFVRSFSDARIGGHVRDVFYDASKYWRKNATGEWIPFSQGDLKTHLFVTCGLSDTREGGPSEIDQAFAMIHEQQTIKAAFPFLYRDDGLVVHGRQRYLNYSTVRPLLPADRPVDWGEGFPILAQYFDSIFADPGEVQLAHLMSWMRHAYDGALRGNMQRGLSLCAAGPPGAGKTFFSNAIVGKIMGQSADATAFLTGADAFNSNLFGAPIWSVDDAVLDDYKHRDKFSQIIKRVTANDELTCRGMYKEGVTVPWVGRCVVTMNDDPDSLLAIPATERNVLDKILLLRVKDTDLDVWPSDDDLEPELPFFCRWLLDHDTPDTVTPDHRFGLKPYHHPELLSAAHSMTRSAGFGEILDMWEATYFSGDDAPPSWVGNSTELIAELKSHPHLEEIVRANYGTPTTMGVHLRKIVSAGHGGIEELSRRRYRLTPATAPANDL